MKYEDILKRANDKRDEVVILDDCEELYVNSSGTSATRYKVWLKYGNDIILFKENKKHVGGEKVYEDISEMIAYDLGNIINVDSIFTKLANYKGMCGTFTYKINNLIELATLIARDNPQYNRLKPFDLINYNVETISKYFGDKNQFYKLMLFDFIMSQSDRHSSNIGFINGSLAPIYDNGNSLGCFIYDDELDRYITSVNKLCRSDLKSSIGINSERPAEWNRIILYLKDNLITFIKDNVINNRYRILELPDRYIISNKRKTLIKSILSYKINFLEELL